MGPDGRWVMHDFERVFNDSYERVLSASKGGPDFFDSFYERFIGSSEEIRAKFKNTDMIKQKQVLRDSLFHMLHYAIDGFATEYLEHLAVMHAKTEKDIPPAMYRIWLESLVATVKKWDPKFDNKVESAWRDVMSPGIEFMIAKYES
ncbi:MAG: globin [Candidatus Omnitrophota bacterium]|nr:globin [Candidatus Omnitrophota bacterium]